MTIKIGVVNKPFLINDESLEIGNVQQVRKRLNKDVFDTVATTE